MNINMKHRYHSLANEMTRTLQQKYSDNSTKDYSEATVLKNHVENSDEEVVKDVKRR
jgi:hypothetical protein